MKQTTRTGETSMNVKCYGDFDSYWCHKIYEYLVNETTSDDLCVFESMGKYFLIARNPDDPEQVECLLSGVFFGLKEDGLESLCKRAVASVNGVPTFELDEKRPLWATGYAEHIIKEK